MLLGRYMYHLESLSTVCIVAFIYQPVEWCDEMGWIFIIPTRFPLFTRVKCHIPTLLVDLTTHSFVALGYDHSGIPPSFRSYPKQQVSQEQMYNALPTF